MTYTIDDGYINVPIDVDPSTIQANALAAISQTLPGWVPQEGHIEVIMLEQMAQMVSVSAKVASQVPLAIFSVFGSLFGIYPIQGAAATAQTVWTMTDTKGYTVPAGTQVGYQLLGNQVYIFSTVSEFTVPVGQINTSTAYPAGITIQAQAVGGAYNGLPLPSPAPQYLTPIVSLSYIASVQFLTPTSGGVDPETTAAYLNRLSNQLHYITPRPILPGDFAGLSTNIADVYRATAFSGLNPFANVLTSLDALFNNSIGSWIVKSGSPCTLSEVTSGNAPHAMRITGTGAGNAAVLTSAYNFSESPYGYFVSAGQNYVALVQLQTASAAREIQVQVNCWDVGGVSTGTFTSVAATNATDLTANNSLFWIPFDPAAGTFTASLEVIVDGITNAETHDVFAAAIMQIPTPTNLLPDSSFLQVNSPTAAVNPGALTWTLSNAALAVGPFATNINGIVYTSSGGTPTYTAKSTPTYLSAGQYTVSAYVDASNLSTSTLPTITVTDITTSSNLAVTWTEGIAEGVALLVYGTFTVPSGGGMIQCTFSTNGCTVPSTETVTFAQPEFLAGVVTPTIANYSVGPTFSQPGQVENQERTVAVSAVQLTPSGQSVEQLSAATTASLEAYLESLREVNFVVSVVPPTFTSIDVQFTGTVWSNYNVKDVLAAAEIAIDNYLNPLTWGQGSGVPPYWDPTQNAVWYLDIATVIGEVPGMQNLNTLQIRYTPSVSDTSYTGWVTSGSLALPGYAPLPQVGNITGTLVTGT